MGASTEDLMTELVEGLQPVSPLRSFPAIARALGAMAVSLLLVLVFGEVRPDVLAARPADMFVLSAGLFLLLGLACTAAVVLMASPRVGASRNGWQWAVAMASVLPATAVILALSRGASAWSASATSHGLTCLSASLGLGLLTSGILVMWLRRGAPSSPERAGLLVGIAAGSAGVFAFSFVCPYDSIMHIGIWHGLAVIVSAAIGRLLVPPLVRW